MVRHHLKSWYLEGDHDLAVDDAVDDVLVNVGCSSTPVHGTDPVTVYQRYRHHQIAAKSVKQTQRSGSEYRDRLRMTLELNLNFLNNHHKECIDY